jgi:hypothetical protein
MFALSPKNSRFHQVVQFCKFTIHAYKLWFKKMKGKKLALNKYLQLYIACFNQRSYNNFLDILMDKNQTTSLIFKHSFGRNLCYRSSNREFYPTLDIPLFKSLIWTRFCALNLFQIFKTPWDSNSQVWIYMGMLGLIFFHFFTIVWACLNPNALFQPTSLPML